MNFKDVAIVVHIAFERSFVPVYYSETKLRVFV